MSIITDILEQRGMGHPCCPGCGMRMRMQQGNCPDCGVKYGLSMGAADAPGMSEEKEEEPTSDFKLDKAGRKIKASKIVFNTGEDDSTKKVQENMKTSYKDLIGKFIEMRAESLHLEDELNEVMSKDAAAGDWISDFVHSDNPKFAGKSKEKRKQMALAAYYAKQKNEEVEIEEGTGSLKPGWMLKKDTELANKVKANQDLNKKREATYGDKDAADKKKESVEYWKRHAELKKHDPRTAKTNEEVEELEELNKDTIHSYAAKSEKDLNKKHKELGAQIRADKSVAANKTAAKIGNRQAGLDRAEDRLNKEEVELDEADKISTAQMGHAGKTTIKHIKNPDVTQRMAAHDVKSYADRIALLKDAKRKGNLKEEDMDESIKWNDGTSTYHDVKKTSTGTVYTKQFGKDGMSKGSGEDAAKKAVGAEKRGRGRPKKDKFAESVEVLMGLSEEQFDSMMEEGFDAFFEAFEQIDELSKDTLKSYIKNAAHSASNTGAEFGSRHAAGQEVERFTNRHMADKFANKDKMKAMVGASNKEVGAALHKTNKRVAGIKTAVDKLTK